jgi:putative heme-binding domain-containing protein
MRPALLALALTLTPTLTLRAQQQHIAPTDAKSPADERASFTVPAGFDVQLVAAEPDIQKPIQMAFDAKGRLWVTTSYLYPFPAAKGKGTDKLFILSDFGPDGRAKKVQVFADNLNIPIGILPLPDCKSCLVSSAGVILKLTDTDGDGKADKTEELFTGFGFKDTHGMVNSFTLMPDGWVYACHGYANASKVKGKDGHEVEMHSGNTFRFRPDGSRIEVYTRGQVNPFGMAVDPWFNLYTADCHSKPITQLIPGAVYESFGKPHDGLGFGPNMIGHDHGSTALCGLTYYDADQFPPQYRNTMFLGNVVTNRINFDKIEWTGSTPRAVENPDFLVSKDPWFRPTDIKLGPDGALYVADFYNKIIGHYEVDLKHPQRDKDRGRVWRIVWKGKDGTAPPPKMPRADWTKATYKELNFDLVAPNLTVRMIAGQELLRREKAGENPKQLDGDAALKALSDPYHASLLAGWLAFQAEAHKEPVPAKSYREVIEYGKQFHPTMKPDQHSTLVVRALTSRPTWDTEERAVALDILKSIDAPRLRRAVVEGITSHPHAEWIPVLVELIQKCPPADTHLKHAARIALRNQFQGSSTPAAVWEAAEKLPADATPILVEIMLGVPNTSAADYLAQAIKGGRVSENRIPAFAQHVGRYGDQTAMLSVIDSAIEDQKDRVKAAATIQAMVRGLQSANGELKIIRSTSTVLRRVREDLEGGPRETRLASLRLLADLAVVIPKNLKYRGVQDIDPVPGTTALLGDASQPDDVRTAVLDALIRLDPKLAQTSAEKLIDDHPTPPAVREKAALLLAGSDNRNHKQAAKDAIKDVPYRSAVAIAAGLAGSRDGGEILLTAVKQGKAPARLLQERQILDRLRTSQVPDLDRQVADLTKGLQPADQKLAALLKQRAARFPQAKTDKELGAKLFAKHCGACHQIGGMGAKVGPQLDGIGNRGLERLLEDVLDPNRNVDAEFRARVLNLADGRTLTGLMLRVEGEVVVFADDQGKEFRIPSKDIEKNRETTLSPMPANFGETIPEADFHHLMAYLLDQRVKDPPKK